MNKFGASHWGYRTDQRGAPLSESLTPSHRSHYEKSLHFGYLMVSRLQGFRSDLLTVLSRTLGIKLLSSPLW